MTLGRSMSRCGRLYRRVEERVSQIWRHYPCIETTEWSLVKDETTTTTSSATISLPTRLYDPVISCSTR